MRRTAETVVAHLRQGWDRRAAVALAVLAENIFFTGQGAGLSALTPPQVFLLLLAAVVRIRPWPRRVPSPCDEAEAEAREGARILSAMIERAKEVKPAGLGVSLSFDVPQPVFDRLCVWGATRENDEGDDREEDTEMELEEFS